MRCSQAVCNRGIGLVWYRRWVGNGLSRPRSCRNHYAPARPMPASDAKLFAWLLAPEAAHRQLVLAPVRVRAR